MFSPLSRLPSALVEEEAGEKQEDSFTEAEEDLAEGLDERESRRSPGSPARRWSFKSLNFRHHNVIVDEKAARNAKNRKAKSSSDIRTSGSRDDVSGDVTAHDNGLSSSPETPQSSPPVVVRPTSRRKKIWNSFRTRAKRLRGKYREKDVDFFNPASSGDGEDAASPGKTSLRNEEVNGGPPAEVDTALTASSTTRFSSYSSSSSSSSFRRWRSSGSCARASTTSAEGAMDVPAARRLPSEEDVARERSGTARSTQEAVGAESKEGGRAVMGREGLAEAEDKEGSASVALVISSALGQALDKTWSGTKREDYSKAVTQARATKPDDKPSQSVLENKTPSQQKTKMKHGEHTLKTRSAESLRDIGASGQPSGKDLRLVHSMSGLEGLGLRPNQSVPEFSSLREIKAKSSSEIKQKEKELTVPAVTSKQPIALGRACSAERLPQSGKQAVAATGSGLSISSSSTVVPLVQKQHKPTAQDSSSEKSSLRSNKSFGLSKSCLSVNDGKSFDARKDKQKAQGRQHSQISSDTQMDSEELGPLLRELSTTTLLVIRSAFEPYVVSSFNLRESLLTESSVYQLTTEKNLLQLCPLPPCNSAVSSLESSVEVIDVSESTADLFLDQKPLILVSKDESLSEDGPLYVVISDTFCPRSIEGSQSQPHITSEFQESEDFSFLIRESVSLPDLLIFEREQSNELEPVVDERLAVLNLRVRRLVGRVVEVRRGLTRLTVILRKKNELTTPIASSLFFRGGGYHSSESEEEISMSLSAMNDWPAPLNRLLVKKTKTRPLEVSEVASSSSHQEQAMTECVPPIAIVIQGSESETEQSHSISNSTVETSASGCAPPVGKFLCRPGDRVLEAPRYLLTRGRQAAGVAARKGRSASSLMLDKGGKQVRQLVLLSAGATRHLVAMTARQRDRLRDRYGHTSFWMYMRAADNIIKRWRESTKVAWGKIRTVVRRSPFIHRMRDRLVLLRNKYRKLRKYSRRTAKRLRRSSKLFTTSDNEENVRIVQVGEV